MYLNSDLISSPQNSFHGFVTPQLAHETPRRPTQLRRWQSTSLQGVELVEKQGVIDPNDWRESLPGKLLFAFVDAHQASYKTTALENARGLARIVFSRQSVDYMQTYDMPLRTLELRVDETRFREELSRHLDRPVGNIKLAPVLEGARSYGNSLYLMVKTLHDLYVAGAHPAVLKHQGAAILTALVQGPFHNHWHNCIEKLHPPSMARVHAVTAYIQTHLKDALTLDDLTRVAGCGARSLQMAFDKHLGQTPLEYLRIQRLEAAHQALSEGGHSVTEIVYDYGFSNPGRFAKAFQERFGKRPSDVLRKP
ncbi:MAG: helix-turn-helix transcriptional regulator [Candidatus Competibacteraceae bacterium]|nr:helix-turn-helix transcriptional regulator [Candidatus Competibacteraceae bacterium]